MKKIALALAILWAVGIFILGSLPGKDLPQVDISRFDLIEHCGAFGLLAYLFLHAEKFPAHYMVIGVSLYGIGLEYWQRDWLPYFVDAQRVFGWDDATANALGALIGYVFWRWQTRKS